MKHLLVLIGCLGYVICQDPPGPTPSAGPGNTTTNGTTTGTTNGTAACDPFLRDCPGSSCEPGEVGRLIVLQPGRNTYAYVGTPINITWMYTPSTDNTTYPRNGFEFYYKKKEDTDWKRIGFSPKGNSSQTSFLWNPTEPLLKDTRYELLVLVDNVTSLPKTPGNTPSCLAPGFPVGNFLFADLLGYPEEFVVLSPPTGTDPNNPESCTKFCPSVTNDAATSTSVFSFHQFLLYLELIGGAVAFLY
jgi:hypothetical protein